MALVAFTPKAEQAVDAAIESRLARRRASYNAAKASKIACEIYEQVTGTELPQIYSFEKDGRHFRIRLWAEMEEYDPEQEPQHDD